MNSFPRHSDEWFVYNQLCDLQEIARNGLHSAYQKLEDFWYDFWPNFSWDEKRLNAQVRLLLGHSEFEQLEQDLLARFGESLREELTRELPRESIKA